MIWKVNYVIEQACVWVDTVCIKNLDISGLEYCTYIRYCKAHSLVYLNIYFLVRKVKAIIVFTKNNICLSKLMEIITCLRIFYFNNLTIHTLDSPLFCETCVFYKNCTNTEHFNSVENTVSVHATYPLYMKKRRSMFVILVDSITD